ncbi:DUF6193 family natural product biosynthesis protein [Nocardia sp. NPDC049220]|uniref:DUF6193 family natural product biosynthesis protein n=1 Tax=Nocardia sp. NPDC049220 TaxID=3155273 RepID=UPI0033C4624C
MAESEWCCLRTEATELVAPGTPAYRRMVDPDHAWASAHRALIEAAYAEPGLRRLYPFKSMWDLRFSTTTGPNLSAVGPWLSALALDRYTIDVGDFEFSTAGEAVAAAVRHLPSDLAPVTLGTEAVA